MFYCVDSIFWLETIAIFSNKGFDLEYFFVAAILKLLFRIIYTAHDSLN